MLHNILSQLTAFAERRKGMYVFLILWIAILCLYLPAMNAGFVGDIRYWIEDMRHQTMWQYMNPPNAGSMYQIEQLNIYVLYHLFGKHGLPWHLFHCTLHALNCYLLFRFIKKLLADSHVADATLTALAGSILLALCPQASEPLVWRAANHFLQGTMMILIVLNCVQGYWHTSRTRYVTIAIIAYLYSSFSLEVFYMTPIFALLLTIYYHIITKGTPGRLNSTVRFIFAPLLFILIMHFVLLRVFLHSFVSHYGHLDIATIWYYLDKPLKYIYHVVFMGRFNSIETRKMIYGWCEQKGVIIAVYTSLIAFWIYSLIRISKISPRTRVVALLSAMAMMTYLFLAPLIFADLWLVNFDRYTYLSATFSFPLLAVILGAIGKRIVPAILIVAYAMLCLYLTAKEVKLWRQSEHIIDRLLNTMPDPGNKKVLLLNLPHCLKGVHMISSQPEGRFKTMRNTIAGQPAHTEMYDVMSYNMESKNDGAHVHVDNDSTVSVTLNQWGTWWLYSLSGGMSYENEDYRVNMTDPGHWYKLILKHPADQYMILYQVGDSWHVADWSKKNIDQN